MNGRAERAGLLERSVSFVDNPNNAMTFWRHQTKLSPHWKHHFNKLDISNNGISHFENKNVAPFIRSKTSSSHKMANRASFNESKSILTDIHCVRTLTRTPFSKQWQTFTANQKKNKANSKKKIQIFCSVPLHFSHCSEQTDSFGSNWMRLRLKCRNESAFKPTPPTDDYKFNKLHFVCQISYCMQNHLQTDTPC